MDGFMVILILLMLVFYVGVLISHRATVRDHPYIALATAAFLIAQFILPLEIVGPLLIGSAIWAAYDVRKLQVYKYRVGGVTNVVTAFFGCWFLWPIFFPWVLINRHMILDGTAKLKGNYRKVGKPATRPERCDTSGDVPATPTANETAEQPKTPKVAFLDVAVEEVEADTDDGFAEAPSANSVEPPRHSRSDPGKRKKTNNMLKVIFGIGIVFIIGVTISHIMGSHSSVSSREFDQICSQLRFLHGQVQSEIKFSDEFQASGAFFGNTRSADGNLRKTVNEAVRVGFFLIPNAYPDGVQPAKKNMLLYSFVEDLNGQPLGDTELNDILIQSWDMHPFVTGLNYWFGYESDHYHIGVNGKAMVATHFYHN